MREALSLKIIVNSSCKQSYHSLEILVNFNGTSNDDPVCKTGKKTQMCITDFWTQREGGGDDLGEWEF